MSIKLLTEHHLKFLSLIGGCTGSCESTLAKMPHCLELHATAHIVKLGLLKYESVGLEKKALWQGFEFKPLLKTFSCPLTGFLFDPAPKRGPEKTGYLSGFSV